MGICIGSLARLLVVPLFSLCLLISSGVVFSQEKTEGKPEAATAEAGEKKTEEGQAGAEAATKPEKEAEPEKTTEELREEMLERLADNLSRRSKMLGKRERGLIDREQELLQREQGVAEREQAIADLEMLLESRARIIRRREKLPPPQAWTGPKAPSAAAKHVAVLDGQTMQFYYEKSSNFKIPVASTQKLLTAILICEAGNLDDELTVPKEVDDVEPTVIGVRPGEKYTRRQILTGLLVKSGNDLAATLAIDNAGSIEAFAVKMNRMAKALGMDNSNFKNPHGLPAKGQYSTAHDIALAAFEAYQIPDIRDMVKRRTFDFHMKSGKIYKLYNTNRVLGTMKSCNGMKTGFTYASGNCLVSSCSEDGKDRICVMIKSYRPNVWTDSQKMLEWSLGLKFPEQEKKEEKAGEKVAAVAG